MAENKTKEISSHKDESLETIIGPGTFFKGTMKVENSVRIEGIFNGRIFCGGSLTITPSGEVWATLEGKEVYVHGTVNGTVQAEKVQLDKESCFIGDIRTRTLSISPGAVFHGRSINFEEDAPDNQDEMPAAPLPEVGADPAG